MNDGHKQQAYFYTANPNGMGSSFNEQLGASFGRLQGDGSSFGGNAGGSFMLQNGFLVGADGYRSSVGLEEGVNPLQIYEYTEPQLNKGLLFRSSGDFEMQFEDMRIERLNLGMGMKIEENSREHNKSRSFGEESGPKSSRQQSGSYEADQKLESGELINTKFKPEIKQLGNQNLIQDNKSLFNVNQAKSIYTNKITQLVEQVQTKVNVSPTISPRQSQIQIPKIIRKSQQKLQRKASNNLREQLDLSSDMNQHSSQSGDPNQDPVQQKLAKNRESARNSRARKKIYYELLETKVKELQDEVDRLRDACKNQSKTMEMSNKSQEKFSMFLDQQQKLFDKLETCLIKGRDNSEVGMILDALRYRTNSNSQERNDAARAYFDAIVEVCLPIQTKYLLYALERNKDFFAQQGEDYTEWMREPFKKSEIKPEQIVKVKRMKTKLQGVKTNVTESIQKIKDQLKLIQSEAGKVDQMWEQLKECLTPTQLGNCILAMRQNAYRPELQTSALFANLKNSQMSEEDQDFNLNIDEQFPNQTLRKHVKKSQ